MGTPAAGGGESKGQGAHGEELERVASSLEATTAIVQAVVGETDLDAVLDLIVTRGLELVAARWSAILIVDGDELELRATAGDVRMRPIGSRYRIDDTAAGRALRSGKPLTVTDLSRQAVKEERALVEELGAEHALLLPLTFRGDGVGVLMVASDLGDGDGFSTEQRHLLLAFAASAATAVVTARTVAADRLRQSVAAAERERRRWARELHDETLQELGAMMMSIDTARGREDSDLGEVLSRVAESLAATTAGLHRMIAELRPAALDALGVAAAVTALAEGRRSPGLEVVVYTDLDYEADRRPARLAPEVEGAIYRIVQEALTNVSKHADATCVSIEVIEADGCVTVEVRDDGRGMGVSGTSGTQLGIHGMRERAALLGGALTVESDGAGTVVLATLPALRA